MKKSVAILGFLLVSAQAAPAQSAADSAAIRATALDYVEGWYTADAARMERAVHPELAKRIVQSDQNGRSRLGQQSAMTLVSATRGTQPVAADQQVKDIRILDIFGNSASVRADMAGWIDYMHMAKWNGQWRVVNVLWELRAR